jgi:hypothetical protein
LLAIAIVLLNRTQPCVWQPNDVLGVKWQTCVTRYINTYIAYFLWALSACVADVVDMIDRYRQREGMSWVIRQALRRLGR